MGFRFVGQPFANEEQIGEIIAGALRDPAYTRLWIATAWGKQSGLSRLAKDLEAFRSRGGTAEVVLGVDEGGASIEGLRLATTLFDSPYVFHDPGARTFHPKIYVAEGDARATGLVGSGNLTRGGLYTNYEAAVAADLDLTNSDERAFRDSVRGYFDRLVALMAACKPLDEQVIDDLVNDPRVVVASEKRSNQQRQASRGRGASVIFGGSAVPDLRGAPAPTIPPLPAEDQDEDAVLAPAVPPVPVPVPVPLAAAPVVLVPTAATSSPGGSGFFKALSNNDVSLRDSPGQIIIPINFLPFFGTLNLRKDELATGGPRQEDKEFSLTFRDGGTDTPVDSGRVILYVPAASHKRKNSEVRFTFRNRGVLMSLAAGDVLAFSHQPAGDVLVERHPPTWRPAGVPATTRYGVL